MLARLLLALLLTVSLAGCGPDLRNNDDDDSGDDDDATGDDDDATGDDDDTTSPDDDDTTSPDDDDTTSSDDDDDDDATSDPGDDDDDVTPMPITPVIVCDSTAPASFVISGWSVSGDFLDATFEYSGGCEIHDFQLCWDGTFMESWPVQAALIAQDYGPADPCLAYITEIRTFDLAPLSDAWIQGYGAPPGEIIVNLASASQSYTF